MLERRNLVVIGLILLCAACGNSSKASPTTTTTAPAGTVISSNQNVTDSLTKVCARSAVVWGYIGTQGDPGDGPAEIDNMRGALDSLSNWLNRYVTTDTNKSGDTYVVDAAMAANVQAARSLIARAIAELQFLKESGQQNPTPAQVKNNVERVARSLAEIDPKVQALSGIKNCTRG